jgi:putative transposase
MTTHRFAVGETVVWQGVRYQIVDGREAGEVQLRDCAKGFTRMASIGQMRIAYARRELRFQVAGESKSTEPSAHTQLALSSRPFSSLSEKTQARTRRQRDYLRRLDDCGVVRFDRRGQIERSVAAVAAELGDSRPPSRSTIYRWRQSQRAAGAAPNVVAPPRFDRCGGRGVGRFPDEVEAEIVRVFDDIYLTPQRLSLVETHAQLEIRINALNRQRLADDQLPVPSLRTLQHRATQLNKFEVESRRHGVQAAKRRFTPALGGLRVSRILERVEVDHTPLNLFIVDDTTYLPLGRPDVTVALDAYSRMVVGMHYGFAGHGADAVLQCLRHAILPKDYLSEKFPDIALDWPAFGLPSTLAVDNGLEFAGGSLAQAAQDLGIDLHFMPARKPQWKGRVERFFRTFAHQFVHRLPGTTFHTIQARGDYDPSQCAIITLSVFDQLCHRWVVDEYLNTVHRALNARPVDVWTRSAAEFPPALVDDPERLDFLLGEHAERTLWHYGIQLFHSERYNSPELQRLFASLGRARVRVRFQRADIGVVWVEDPLHRGWIKVANVQPEYAAGLSLVQHSIISNRQRMDGSRRVDRQAKLASKEALRNEVREALASRQLRTRRAAARTAGVSRTSENAVARLMREVDAAQVETTARDGDQVGATPVVGADDSMPRPTYAIRSAGASAP